MSPLIVSFSLSIAFYLRFHKWDYLTKLPHCKFKYLGRYLWYVSRSGMGLYAM
jgi:hypothetical protein